MPFACATHYRSASCGLIVICRSVCLSSSSFCRLFLLFPSLSVLSPSLVTKDALHLHDPQPFILVQLRRHLVRLNRLKISRHIFPSFVVFSSLSLLAVSLSILSSSHLLLTKEVLRLRDPQPLRLLRPHRHQQLWTDLPGFPCLARARSMIITVITIRSPLSR